MQLPFLNPVSAGLLFMQALLLYLKFDSSSGFDDAWGIALFPTFVAEFFLIAMLASEALLEGSDRRRNDASASEASETSMSYVLLEMITAVLLLLTTALFVFYLDDDTELPLFWITTSFFGATLLFFVTTLVMCKTTWEKARCKGPRALAEPYETIRQRGVRTVFVGGLVAIQGLFLWLYNSPWGRVMDVGLFWVLLPTLIELVISFIVSVRQTHFRRNNPGPNLVRQGAFILLILLLIVSAILLILHLDYALIDSPKIVLPLLVYSALLIPVSLYVYYAIKKLTPCPKPILPTTGTYSPVPQSTPGGYLCANIYYADGNSQQVNNASPNLKADERTH